MLPEEDDKVDVMAALYHLVEAAARTAGLDMRLPIRAGASDITASMQSIGAFVGEENAAGDHAARGFREKARAPSTRYQKRQKAGWVVLHI